MKTIKETMLQTMVKIYGKVSAQQKENGKSLFGDGTFVIYGQCTGVYYAALYTENNPLNPYYHDKTCLLYTSNSGGTNDIKAAARITKGV